MPSSPSGSAPPGEVKRDTLGRKLTNKRGKKQPYKHLPWLIDSELDDKGARDRASLAQPLDDIDRELLAAMAERRPFNFEKAFPEPPTTLEEMDRMAQEIEDGQVPTPPLPPAPLEMESVQPVAPPLPLRRRGGFRAPAPPETVPSVPAEGGRDQTPAERMHSVAAQSPEYLREYQMRVLHRLLMRNLPLDQIAMQLQLSTNAVYRLRAELFKRLAFEAQHLNRYELAGKTMGFYDEVQGTALRLADQASASMHHRLIALQTALAAAGDRQKFLAVSGFWAAAPFKPQDAIEDNSTLQASKLNRLIEAVIDDKGDAIMDGDATAEQDAQNALNDTVRVL